MRLRKQKANYAGWLYTILTVTIILCIGYTMYVQDAVYTNYDQANKQLATQAPIEVLLDNTDQKIYITDQSLFTDQGIWTYVGPTRPYPQNYKPLTLEDISVEHSRDQKMKLSSQVTEPLIKLFKHAKDAGYNLIVASAYRSIDDQSKLYDEFVDRLGQDNANSYVATPGHSEHHSGLAVDIDDFSEDCQNDSNLCYISLETADWLANNAYKFGFILRYPEGKQPITDMAYESWHYRYVGVPLARGLTESGLTFDEFIAQVAPGRINN